jgi:hypothetical protein
MFPYVKPGIEIVNVSDEPPHILEQYKIMSKYHRLGYITDLPKRLVMWNNLDDNPYHLFFYMLGKLFTVDNEVDPVIFYYPKSKSHIAEEAMRLLPKRFERRLEKEEGYEYVHIPGLTFYPDFIGERFIYKYVRDLFKDVCANTKQEPGKYIYISRTNCRNRNVLNEDELIPVLKDIGISVYNLNNLTFIDTIRLFKSAELVTGVHGAGLAWSIFCEPKTILVEIYKNKALKNHYYHLCKELDIEYWRFVDVISDEKTEEKNPDAPDDGDVIVPVQLYRNTIEKLLRSKCKS